MEASESDGGAWIENRTGSGGGECRERKSERVHNSFLVELRLWTRKQRKKKLKGVLVGFVLS